MFTPNTDQADMDGDGRIGQEPNPNPFDSSTWWGGDECDADADGDGYPENYSPSGPIITDDELEFCIPYDGDEQDGPGPNPDAEYQFCDCDDLDDEIFPGADDALNDGIDQNCFDAPPQAVIQTPDNGTTYKGRQNQRTLGFTGLVGDEEDCLDIEWDFGDGNIVDYNNCVGLTSTFGIQSSVNVQGYNPDGSLAEDNTYMDFGMYVVELKATESNSVGPNTLADDPQTTVDTVTIYLNKAGKPKPSTTTTSSTTTTTLKPATTTTLKPATTTTTTTLPQETTSTTIPTTTTLAGGGDEKPPLDGTPYDTKDGKPLDGGPAVVGFAVSPLELYMAALLTSGFRNFILLLILIAGYAVWARDTQLMRAQASKAGNTPKGMNSKGPKAKRKGLK